MMQQEPGVVTPLPVVLQMPLKTALTNIIEHAEGLSDCQKMLLMAKAGKKDGCLIEGMGCPGGCVAGVGTNIAIPKAAQAVRKFVKDSTTALPPKEYSEIDLP